MLPYCLKQIFRFKIIVSKIFDNKKKKTKKLILHETRWKLLSFSKEHSILQAFLLSGKYNKIHLIKMKNKYL